MLIQKAVGQPQEAFSVLDRGFNNIAQHIQEVQIVVIHLLCELVELAVVANHQQNIQEVEARLSKAISPDYQSLVHPVTHPVAITD